MSYPIPQGVHAIPTDKLDLRPDSEIDHDLTHPKPITDERNIWFFWHSGYENMYPYTQRNIRGWYRRLAPLGWTVRVTNRQPGSMLNIGNFLDVTDPHTFPQAFIDGTLRGDYAPQHTSDLVRWPLLLKYGGAYADVGMIQIGDLDRMWHSTVADAASPIEILSYNMGTQDQRCLTNYFLCSRSNNPFFERCHRLLLALWAEDGGKTSTEGMHRSGLLKGLELLGDDDGDLSFEENGRRFSHDEVRRMLTDYIIQGQATTMVMGLVDDEDGWNGPKYVAEHVYAIDYVEGSQLINVLTEWSGVRAFELMSLPMPKEGEEETEDQRKAREIVESCLSRSFGFKLATGLILRVIGETLSSMWRKNGDSDNVPGTYAHWFRYGVVHWTQDELPPRMELPPLEPYKKGPLLREA